MAPRQREEAELTLSSISPHAGRDRGQTGNPLRAEQAGVGCGSKLVSA